MDSRIDFYETYFKNLSPTTFVIKQEGGKIIISGFDKKMKKNFRTTDIKQYPVNQEEFEEGGVLQNPNLKQWFGSSKVVDENGNPLVVYHGTPDAIKVFSEDYAGATTANNEHGAFYFSNEYDVAEDYSRQAIIRRYEGRDAEELAYNDELSEQDIEKIEENVYDYAEENLKVVSAYVRMENPLIIDMKGGVIPIMDMQDVIGYIKNGTYSDVVERYIDYSYNYDQDDINYYREDIEERARENESLEEDEEIEDWQFESATQEVLDENSIEAEIVEYDGIIVRNTIDDIGEKSNMLNDVYIVINPTSIKSAIGNNGEYNPNNSDIVMKKGGEISSYFKGDLSFLNY